MAEAAVKEYRTLEGIATGAGGKLTMDEHLIGIDARLDPLFQLLENLRRVGKLISRFLWPDLDISINLLDLCDRLGGAPARFKEWCRSAARAGSKVALDTVLSWYHEVDIDQLATRRESDEPVDEEFASRVHSRACVLASFADVSELIPAVDGEVASEDDVSVSAAFGDDEDSEETGSSSGSGEADEDADPAVRDTGAGDDVVASQ